MSAARVARPSAWKGCMGRSGSNERGHPSCQASSSAVSAARGSRVPEGTPRSAYGTASRSAVAAIKPCPRPARGNGPGRTRRNTASAANAARATCTARVREAPPSQVQDATQNASESSGIARHGERTTRTPGRATSAAAAATARASSGSVSSTAGFYAPRCARPARKVRSRRMPAHHVLIYLFTGAAAGLVGAMLGIGGGVFLVPPLTLPFPLPILPPAGANLFSLIATATASSTVNLDRGLVNMRLAMALEVATSVGGLGGGLAASLLSTQQLFLLFGGTLAVMGALMMMRSGRRNVIADTSVDPGRLGGRLQEGDTAYVYRVRRMPLALGASLVAGAVSGLLGLGGGIVKVPVLNTFCGVPIRVAAATSAFMIGVTAAASVFIYFARGDVVLPIAAAVALGARPASIARARLGQRVEARALKIFMAEGLLLVGGRVEPAAT